MERRAKSCYKALIPIPTVAVSGSMLLLALLSFRIRPVAWLLCGTGCQWVKSGWLVDSPHEPLGKSSLWTPLVFTVSMVSSLSSGAMASQDLSRTEL